MNQAFPGCTSEENIICEELPVVLQKLKKNIYILRNAPSVAEFRGFRRGSDSRINLNKDYFRIQANTFKQPLFFVSLQKCIRLKVIFEAH